MDHLSGQEAVIFRLAVALAVGFLIGLERGWKERDRDEGDRVAGVRTYALLGLLGGGSGLLAHQLGAVMVGFAFVAVAGVTTTAYVMDYRRTDEVGITSLVASLLTFLLGTLAGIGEVVAAGATAVVAALLLGFKPVLHHWLGALRRRELYAGLKLLLISVVLLPILPDRGYGPWAAVNPYELWWLVVLVAALSFLGYFAIRLAGARRGALYTGLAAGLASSTALTLHFSRLARSDSQAAPVLGLGILLSCGIMFPRMVLVLGVVKPGLVMPALAPLAAMAMVIFAVAGFLVWRRMPEPTEAAITLENPLELRMALGFGALLALVMLLARALKAWFGDTGVLILAGVSGSANIDAITLSLARMTGDGLDPRVAVTGLVIAAATNNVVKGAMAITVGGRAVGAVVAVPLVVSALAGAVAVWLGPW